MYIKIPAKEWIKNDSMLNKPIMYKDKPVGVITSYDDIYIYGVLWVTASNSMIRQEDDKLEWCEFNFKFGNEGW